MKPKRRTPEQIIGKLREADAMLAVMGRPKYFDNQQYGIVNGNSQNDGLSKQVCSQINAVVLH